MKKIRFEGHIYTVSFEAMPKRLKEALSKEDLVAYLTFLEKVQVAPKKIYKELRAFAKNHPEVPEVLNLLAFAHIRNRRLRDAEELIEQTFTNFPNYFFAKINFADQCIRKNHLNEIPKIFPSFDLQKISPGKSVYHTSEFRGFMVMMAHYQMALKDRDKALTYFQTAKKVEPHHPSVLFLQKKLCRKGIVAQIKGLVKRLLKRSSQVPR